jgi:hypothetical protein
MDIQKLKRDIRLQTRNGRQNVYITLEDLRELQKDIVNSFRGDKIFVGIDYLEWLIKNYEEKQKRVNTQLINVDGENYTFKQI